MRQLTWEDITVKQIQAVLKATTDTSIPAIERLICIISALYDIPAEQVENMALDAFKELSEKAIDFAGSLPVVKPVRAFKVNNRSYKFNYNLTRLTLAQIKILQELAKDYNLQKQHLFLACIVQPVNRWGWKKQLDEDVIKADMLSVPAIHAVAAANYFNELFVRMQTYN